MFSCCVLVDMLVSVLASPSSFQLVLHYGSSLDEQSHGWTELHPKKLEAWRLKIEASSLIGLLFPTCCILELHLHEYWPKSESKNFIYTCKVGIVFWNRTETNTNICKQRKRFTVDLSLRNPFLAYQVQHEVGDRLVSLRAACMLLLKKEGKLLGSINLSWLVRNSRIID